MNEEIWRVLAQILFNCEDFIDIIKPFFDNLKSENINDEKYIPFLKTFSQDQIDFLYQLGIIREERFISLFPWMNSFIYQNQSSLKFMNDSNYKIIEEIISGDKIKELQELIQVKDIKTFTTILKSFKDVQKMKIPLIQYCIMKKAIKCFKYLLVNGYDNPNLIMEEENPYPEDDDTWESQHKFEWDSMSTAIYFGNKEIIKILEEKGIKKGNNPTHIEAAILSYRNIIAKEIIEEMNEKNIEIENFNYSLRANINAYDEKLYSILKIEHPFIMLWRIIQKRY